MDSWIVEGGSYRADVAASSRDIRTSVSVDLTGDAVLLPLSRNSTIGEVLAHPVAGPRLMSLFSEMMGDGGPAVMPDGVDISRMLDSFPIGRAAMFAAAGDFGLDPTAMIEGLLSEDS